MAILPTLERLRRVNLDDYPEDERVVLGALVHFYFGGETLLEFIARVAPNEPPPPHLLKLVKIFQRCRTERVRALVSMPPRAGKSITVKRAIAWWLSRSPRDLCCYASYNSDFAVDQSRAARDIAEQAGLRLLDDKSAAGNWRIDGGGGLFSAGLNAGITGRGVNGLFIVDDPYANPRDAGSVQVRETVRANFDGVVRTRLEGDASCIVIHTRWHEDDLIGQLCKEEDWEHLNITAIAEEGDVLGRAVGDPLWPDRPQFTKESLEKIKRANEFIFAALYQGRPVREGARIFYGDPMSWDPKKTDLTGCTVVIGVDPAASEKTINDFSAAFALAIRPPFSCPTVYVLDGYHAQVLIPQLARDLVAFQRRNYNAPLKVEAVAGFKAVPQILRELAPGLRVDEITPLGDKRQRAEMFAAAYNDGRVLFPLTDPKLPGATAPPPWVDKLKRELREFTGKGDKHDDMVDACAHGFNAVAINASLPKSPARGSVEASERW